jgi:hypothetical protein
MVISHNARALSCDEKSLRVLSSQQFEKGTTLSVLAPFFEGIATCWVIGIARSQEQAGYFELVLEFAKKPAIVAVPASAPRAQRNQPHQNEMREAIERLTTGLYRLPSPRFSHVFRELPSELRSLALTASAAAVIFLLQEKGLVDLNRLVREARKGVKR